MTEPLAVSVAEAGRMVGVSRSMAYDLVRTGEWPSVRIRSRVVVPVRFLTALMERAGVPPASPARDDDGTAPGRTCERGPRRVGSPTVGSVAPLVRSTGGLR